MGAGRQGYGARMVLPRRALQLLPACATTGIGSLPHTQADLALQVAFAHDLPFLPQLPAGHPSELMIPSAVEGLPGVIVDGEGLVQVDVARWQEAGPAFRARVSADLASGDLRAWEPSIEACRAWRPFLFEVESRQVTFAKVQVAGPVTVRWAMRTTTGEALAAVPGLEADVLELVLARALALVKAVKRAGATPVCFLDEPGLFAIARGSAQQATALSDLRVVIAALQREGALVGLHCCGNTDWAAVLALGLDVLSIDARLSLDAVLEERDAWLSFLATGATLALGVVPTNLASTYDVRELCDSIEASLRATLPEGASFEGAIAGLWLTPACGLGLRTAPDAERIVAEVRQAQRLLREVAGR